MAKDPLSKFVQASRTEKDRISVSIEVDDGDMGFVLTTKGGRKATEALIKRLTEVI